MNSSKTQLVRAGFGALAISFLAGSLALANSNHVSNVTAQDLNKNTSSYVGKKVELSGRVDRVLGNGSYIIADSSNAKDPTHSVMVITASPTNDQNMKQQSGIAAPVFKEGDTVKLNGRVQTLSASNEVDTYSPKSDTETINETAATMPVVVVQSNGISKG